MTIALDQVAVVYVDTGPSGAFDVVSIASLPCRLFHVSRQPAATSQDRAELAAMRNLHYSPDYTLPDGAQIEIVEDGQTRRYNCVHGTDGVIRPFAAVIQKRIDITRAD